MCIKTQGKAAEDTEPDLPASVGGSPVVAWVGSGSLQGQGHWQQRSWKLPLGLSPLGGCHLTLPCCDVLCLVTQLCLILCDPMDCSPPGSSVYAVFQARILEWIGISFSRGSSQTRSQIRVSCIAGGFFTTEPLRKPHK